MAAEALTGGPGAGAKQASVRRTSPGWTRRKRVLVATALLALVAIVVISSLLWLVSTPQKEKQMEAAPRRCPGEASAVAPGESADSFSECGSKTLSQEQIAFYEEGNEVVNSILTTRPPVKSDLLSVTDQLRLCLGGVVTVEEGGRFGNMFLEWASAWAVAHTHNLTLATPTLLQTVLLEAFKKLPTGPTIIAMLKNCSFGYGLVEGDVFRTVEGANDTEAVAAFAAAVANASSAASVPGPLVLQAGVVLGSYIARVATKLRAQVVWKDHQNEMAQSKLRTFGELTAEKFRVPFYMVVFVGVHVRRKDYPNYLRERLNLTLEATVPYYLRAVRHLSRTLEVDAEAGGRHSAGPLALVVSSDDMDWVRDNLLPAFDNLTRHEAIRLASFSGGIGNDWSALRDLALLSACNHSIISYGTYGVTAGLLAGGHVVAFELKSDYHTSQIANVLPSWSVLR